MLQDLRFTLRTLAKAPGFAAVVVLSLALGIGANTTVFCWMENLIFRPLPGVARQDQLVLLTTSQAGKMWDTVSLPDLRDVAKHTDVFAGICGSQQTPAYLRVEQDAEWIYGQIVTANFFEVLGVQPLVGRGFLPSEDEKPSGHPVLVISEKLWRERFGGAQDVIGRTVELNRHRFTIVGVAPASFHGDTAGLICDFWAPVMMHHEVAYPGIDANAVLQRYSRWHHTYARLQPGVSLRSAQTVLDQVSAQLENAYPATNRAIKFHVHALWQATYGAQSIFRPVLGLLLAVSLGVLLIVTANVGNLLLARATSRRKEIAVRLAIGAGRGRLIRQLLTESLVLAFAGGTLGVLFSFWTVDLVSVFIPKTPLPVDVSMPIHGGTLLATLGLTLVSGLLFGLVPALQASRPQLSDTLKENGRSAGAGASHHRMRSTLVVIEVALALVLLISAGLCLKGLSSSRRVDAGLDADGVLLAGLRVGMNGYTRDTAPAFYATLRQRLAALPGVESVGLANWFPLGFEDTGTGGVEIPGQPQRKGEELNFRLAIVSPDYFATLRIPLLAGRDFNDRDDRKAARVAIVNEAFAQRCWPGQQAVGRVFKADGRELTVVGVVRSGKYRSLNDALECFYYLPSSQATWALDLGLCVRIKGANPESMTEAVRREVQALDSNVGVWRMLPMTAYVSAALMPQRIAAVLLSVLSVIALILAAMGVYAVMAYAVSQRTQEFGVRIALGATPGDVLWQVSRQGLRLAAIGLGLGVIAAAAVTRLLSGFLYGVSPFDPLTFTAIPLLLAAVALCASYVPARRATQVNPIDALRAE